MSLFRVIAFVVFLWAATVDAGWMHFGRFGVLLAVGLASLALDGLWTVPILRRTS